MPEIQAGFGGREGFNATLIKLMGELAGSGNMAARDREIVDLVQRRLSVDPVSAAKIDFSALEAKASLA